MSYHTTYRSFLELLRGVDGYVDEISPYEVNTAQTLTPLLPAELRSQIYSYLLAPVDGLGFPPRLIILAKVNEATRFEAFLYYLRNHCLCVFAPSHRRQFTYMLEQLPGEQGFAAVRRIKFSQFSRQSPEDSFTNPNMDFMLRCIGVRKLWLQFDAVHLLNSWGPYTPLGIYSIIDIVGVLSVDQVVKRYRLKQIFDAPESLQVVVVALSPWVDIVQVISDETEAVVYGTFELLQGLVEWLRAGFQERGRVVEVPDPWAAVGISEPPVWPGITYTKARNEGQI